MPCKDPVQRKAYQKLWRERNRDSIYERNRIWRATHREKVRKSSVETERRARLEILQLLGGGRCARCGFSDWRALQVDHIHSDGHLVNRKGNWLSLPKIRATLADAKQRFQVLCANCNWIKRHEQQEFRPPRKW